MKNNKKFLVIYFVIIIILLISIMFILPDSFFKAKYDENIEYYQEQINKQQEEVNKDFVSYATQKTELLNGSYDYEYYLLDTTRKPTQKYECKGTVNKTVETGTCTKPSLLTYTEKTKKTVLKVQTKYLTPKNIFDLLKDIKPTLEQHQTYREYTYKLKINNLDTKIVIQTTKDNISQIFIENLQISYILKYNNVKIDN